MGRHGYKCCESSDYDEEPIVEAVNPITSDTMVRFIMDIMKRLCYSGLFFSEVTRELRAMKRDIATSEALELWSFFGAQFGHDASGWGNSKNNMDVNLWIFDKAVFAAECHDAGWTTRLRVLYAIVNDAIDAACAAGAMRLFAECAWR